MCFVASTNNIIAASIVSLFGSKMLSVGLSIPLNRRALHSIAVKIRCLPVYRALIKAGSLTLRQPPPGAQPIFKPNLAHGPGASALSRFLRTFFKRCGHFAWERK